MKFTSDNTEEYNQPFSLLELKQALQKSNDSAVGPDDIHYKLLTNLPESSLTLLLAVFNSVWESGIFPPSWREATIVVIPKPGKDSSDPNNYRLIALTSCLCNGELPINVGLGIQRFIGLGAVRFRKKT